MKKILFLALLFLPLLPNVVCAQTTVKISDMPNGGNVLTTDKIPIVRNIGGTLTNMQASILYPVPVANGGTGLSALGSALSCIRVNSAGTALEYFTCPGGGGGSGTVTSVAMTGDGVIFNSSVSGSPITGNGTLQQSLISRAANLFFAGPVSGGSAQPSWRAIVPGDIPTLNQNTSGTASNVTGIVTVANGGTNSTSVGGAFETLTGSPTSLGVVLSNRTAANTYVPQTLPKILGTCSLLEDFPNFIADGETQAGIDYQNWLLNCQRKAISMSTTASAELTMPGCILAVTPPTGSNATGTTFNTPIVIPRYVCWDPTDAMYIRDGQSGTVTSNWTGDPSTSALANHYQPNFIFAPQSALMGTLHTVLNAVGTDAGSGPYVARTWRVKSLTIATTHKGTGFVGGETCIMQNGDKKSPAAGAQFTVTTASGGQATVLTFAPGRWDTITGQYFLPPFLQAQQWTTANGWNGADPQHPTVFNSDGSYLTSCTGSGTGLGVVAAWWPDWCDGTNGCSASTTYDGFFGNYNTDTMYIHSIYAEQAGSLTSATYGHSWGVAMSPFDIDVDYVQSQGAYWGQLYTGSDIRVVKSNDVDSQVGLKIFSGGGMHFQHYTGDTSFLHNVEIDKVTTLTLDADLIYTQGTSPTATDGTVIIGGDSTYSDASDEVTNATMRFTSINNGNTAGRPFFSCKFARGNHFFANVGNIDNSGSTVPYQNNAFANLSTNCENSNVFEGLIDNVSTALLTGTDLGVGKNVWKGSTRIWVNSGTPTISSGFGTGAALSATPQASSFSINVGTGGTVSTGVIGLPTAPHGWSCTTNDVTTPAGNDTVQTGSSTTTASLTNYSRTAGTATAWTASDVIQISCFPN